MLIKRQVAVLFSAYRRDEFADPEGFIAQLGVVLEGYDDAVIEYVTSPRTGVQRYIKWPPSIAEMVQACDTETARQATLARYAAIPKPRSHTALPRDTRPGRRANVFVHADAPQYAKMLAIAESPVADPADWRRDETRPGIWIADGWLIGEAPKLDKTWKKPTDEDLLTRYGVATAAEIQIDATVWNSIPDVK